MAGDWIPVLSTLPRSPKIAAISRALGFQHADGSLGAVLRAWVWAGEQTTDGFIRFAAPSDVDTAAGCVGLASAMTAVGWLTVQTDGITFTDWAVYNSSGAKARFLHNRRQAKWRDGRVDGDVDARPSTEASTTEQNSTEQKRTGDLLPPVGDQKNPPTPRGGTVEIEIPPGLQTEGFKAAWAEWLAHRRHSKTSLSPEGQRRGLLKLGRMGEARAIAAIEHSLEMGYRGLVEPHLNGNGKHREEEPRSWLSPQ